MTDMTAEKMVSVVEMYEERLKKAGVPRTPMDPKRTFGSASADMLLSHAHSLCEDAKRYAREPALRRKAGSFLTSIQMCLSFAGWYTRRRRAARSPSGSPVAARRRVFL